MADPRQEHHQTRRVPSLWKIEVPHYQAMNVCKNDMNSAVEEAVIGQRGDGLDFTND